MDRSTVAECVYPIDGHSLPISTDPAARAAPPPLSERASAVAVLLLSLSLWAAIWAAFAAFTSPVPG